MPLVLQTDRLILRPFENRDLEPFVAYRADPAVAKYQGWNLPYTTEQGAEFIKVMQQVQPGTPGEWYQLAIELKAAKEIIGDCAFYLLTEDPQQAEIGFSLARPYQGQGYATEAVARLLDYLFQDLDLHRVRANCDVENVTSVRLMERLGMRREGHFVENLWFKGRWASEYWYGLLRREWLAKSGGRSWNSP